MVNISLYPLVMCQHVVFVCVCCVPCRELGRLRESTYLPARNTTYTHKHDMLPHHHMLRESTYIPARNTTYTHKHDMLPHHHMLRESTYLPARNTTYTHKHDVLPHHHMLRVYLPPCKEHNVHTQARHAATSPMDITKYLPSFNM
jgi:hypothetical protein